MTAVHTVMSATGPIGFVAAGFLLHSTGSATAGFVLVAAAMTAGAAIALAGGPLGATTPPTEASAGTVRGAAAAP